MIELRVKNPLVPPGDKEDPDPDNNHGLPVGKPISKGLKKLFATQAEKILGTIPTHGVALPSHFPTLTSDDWLDPMKTAMTPLIGAYWDAAGGVTREKLGLDPDAWKVTDPHLQEKIEQSTLAFCQETNQTTSLQLNDALSKLRQELVQGLVEQGDTLAELTKRVQGVFDQADKTRAARIAQTEASRAVHAASLESAKSSGVVGAKKWLESANSCDRCKAIAAKFPEGIPLEGEFENTGDGVYGSVGHCPAHPHCRCTITYVLTPEYEEILATVGPPGGSIEPGPLGPEPAPERKVAKPKAPPKPKAAGEPVSSALDMQATGALGKKAKRAIEILDSVHGDGVLPPIPVTGNVKKADTKGEFVYTLTGRPLRINLNPKGDTPRMTTAHEIGHFLDLSGVPRPVKGAKRDWASDPLLAEWHKTVQDTEAVKTLRGMKGKAQSVHVTLPDGRAGVMKANGKYVDYLLDPEELWARSYAQYIATRSGDKTFRKELDSLRETGEVINYPRQWSDAEFAPVAASIDGLMDKLGWRKT